MKLPLSERTCLRCGWVAFGVTREHAEEEVSKFNEFFDKADKETQAAYGGHHSSIAHYEHCSFCGGPYTNFRVAEPGDAPAGVTMSPIIIP